MPLPVARPFADAWTVSHAQEYLRVRGQLNQWRDRQWKDGTSVSRPKGLLEADEALRDALVGHLLFLREQGQIRPMAFADQVRDPWVTSWQALAAAALPEGGMVVPWMNALVAPLAAALRLEMRLGVDPNTSLDPIEAAHRAAVGFVEAGDIEDYQTRLQDCQRTGKNLGVVWRHWQPTLGLRDAPTFDFVPLSEGLLPDTSGIQHVTVTFPSGQLLVADWFRHPAFNTAVKRPEHISLNHEAGRLEHTQWLARLGVVSVGTHFSPEIFQDGDLLQAMILSEEGEASRGASSLGTVTTDLLAVSVVDRQTLEALLAQSLPAAETRAAVEAMVENQGLHEVTVTPGTYHLYFSTLPEYFVSGMGGMAADWSGAAEPVFALASRPLMPALKPVNRRPRP